MEVLGQELAETLLLEVHRAGGIDPGDEVVVGVVADDREARVGQDGRQRKADVAGADDTDLQGIAHGSLLLTEGARIRRSMTS